MLTLEYPTLYHYRARKMNLVIESARQTGSHWCKPSGIWLTPDSDDNWEWFCRAEDFQTNRLKVRFEIKLKPEAKIIWIKNKAALESFELLYSHKNSSLKDYDLINWSEVASDAQGILITPYISECRFGHNWYYPWDCSSACVWDADAIESIRLDENYVPKKDKI